MNDPPSAIIMVCGFQLTMVPVTVIRILLWTQDSGRGPDRCFSRNLESPTGGGESLADSNFSMKSLSSTEKVFNVCGGSLNAYLLTIASPVGEAAT